MRSLTAFLAASSVFALALAYPQTPQAPQPANKPQYPDTIITHPECAICRDMVNDCGRGYGGCYDTCTYPLALFDIPDCNGNKGKKQVCETRRNDCGVVYGGCYPAEGPSPPYAEPPCPPKEDCQICVDRSNECGQMYGGCYDYCKNSTQVFDIPKCNGEEGKQEVCEYFKNDCGEIYGGCYSAEGPIPVWAEPTCPPPGPPPPKEQPNCEICVDLVNDCQKWYGGCFNFCTNSTAIFDIPECNGVTGKQEKCEYFKTRKPCEEVFGGCYSAEGPAPLWQEPDCDPPVTLD